MNLSDDQRLEIIKIEMGLIQSTLDKYDDLIFRNRNWFITLWMGTMGATFTIKEPLFPLFATMLALLYWFTEGMMRHQYWYKYVLRYRTLRENFNSKSAIISNISLYDLTNRYMDEHGTSNERLKKSFFKLEPSVIYGLMALCSLIIWLLLINGTVVFSTNE